MKNIASLDSILKEEMDVLITDITAAHIATGQKATGKTIQSLEDQAKPSGIQLWGASYIGVLERGRKPGGLPRDIIERLREWARAKGISFSSPEDEERYLNSVKWKIIREGTALYRTGGREDILTPPIEAFTERLTNRLYALYSNEITNTIFDFKT